MIIMSLRHFNFRLHHFFKHFLRVRKCINSRRVSISLLHMCASVKEWKREIVFALHYVLRTNERNQRNDKKKRLKKKKRTKQRERRREKKHCVSWKAKMRYFFRFAWVWVYMSTYAHMLHYDRNKRIPTPIVLHRTLAVLCFLHNNTFFYLFFCYLTSIHNFLRWCLFFVVFSLNFTFASWVSHVLCSFTWLCVAWQSIEKRRKRRKNNSIVLYDSRIVARDVRVRIRRCVCMPKELELPNKEFFSLLCCDVRVPAVHIKCVMFRAVYAHT